MKFVPPYGRESEGDNAHYINGNPVEGRQGSIPPADAFEHPMREIVAVIQKSQLTPDATDLMQMLRGIRSQRMNYVQDTGSVNKLSVAVDPPLSSYSLGLPLRVRVAADNTLPVTINAGAGTVAVKTMAGADLAAGDIRANGIAEMAFDGTNFQLVNFFGQGGTGTGPTTNNYINIPFAKDLSGTPNIIEATFTGLNSSLYNLKAGDPFLVQINNTNSGSSIARFHIMGTAPDLGDKPIAANGGGTAALLQGDLQVGDVVLFIYDGARFWIQPNPVISADVTLNVPSQFATPEDACLAIRRKTIAQNARVTILLAKNAGPINIATPPAGPAIVGGYNPFVINHANAERIIVRGEMKIPGAITGSLFQQSGSSSAQRAADGAAHISMLRSRFGVEIVVPATNAGDPKSYGIQNVGPGYPWLQDILVSGPGYASPASVGRWLGVAIGNGRQIVCSNVSCWGLDIGFSGGGVIGMDHCFASFCQKNGILCTTLACMSFTNGGVFASQGGMVCNQNSWFGTDTAWFNCNGTYGVNCADNGQVTLYYTQAIYNWNVDAVCTGLSYLVLLHTAAAGGIGYVSPTPGVLAADGAYVVKGEGALVG